LDQFGELDFRVAEIWSAEPIEEADNLL